MKKLLQFSLLLFATISFGQTPIYQFNFQNASATIGTGTFIFTPNGGGAVTYVTDRSEVAGKAVNILTNYANATLANLPIGNSSRTISCWVYHRSTDPVNIFSYGSSANGQSFGFKVFPIGNQVAFQGFGTFNDRFISHSFALNQWVHYAVTYNGTQVKTYINGLLKDTFTVNLNTANSNFRLGVDVNGGLTTGHLKFDALEIYDSALTDIQIAGLFRENDSRTNLQTTIPFTGLVYANHFTNSNISDSSGGAVVRTFDPINITPVADQSGTANNARQFNLNSYMEYDLTNYPEVRPGSTGTNEFTVSVQIKVDPVYYAALANNQYVTFFTAGANGAIYLRILKSASGAQLQGGFQQSNGTFVAATSLQLTDASFTNNFLTVTLTSSSAAANLITLYANTGQTSTGTATLGPFYGCCPVMGFGYPANSTFSFKGIIDNVYIYNRRLLIGEVSQIVSNNTLSNENFNVNNLKFTMYPNPANDVVRVDLETEVESVEVYSIQGQMVLQSKTKEFSVASLNSGMYLVRVEDENGAFATQKIIKN